MSDLQKISKILNVANAVQTLRDFIFSGEIEETYKTDEFMSYLNEIESVVEKQYVDYRNGQQSEH